MHHTIPHTEHKKQKVVVIVGQTASGKTSLSLELAKKFNGEIISADSRQVYRGMDLGSGKATKEEQACASHYLLDVADPNDVYTAAQFVQDGTDAIGTIVSHDNLPIIVGGTFFYVDALLRRIQIPEVQPNQALRAKLETMSTEALFEELKTQDPRRAATIDQYNRVRLIRALEIADALGAVPEPVAEEKYDVCTIGLSIEPEDLAARIHLRLITRLDEGMVAEVERLHTEGVSWERLESFGLEYQRIAEFLQNKITKEEMIAAIDKDTRAFAKRQMTWLKRDTSIHWIPYNKGEEALPIIKSFLNT